MKFNKCHIGRALIALPDANAVYRETNTNGEYRLVEIGKTQGDIRVEIIKHKKEYLVGHTWWVDANYFDFKERTQREEMERLNYGV